MDPHATLRIAEHAIATQDIIAATTAMRDLEEWIFQGGYVPDGYYAALDGYNMLAEDVNEMLQGEYF